ncbi:thiamine phosphate synthase [Hydrogenimonas sp.]
MKLYALCDEESLKKRGVSPEEFVAKAKSKGATILQYRNKIDSPKRVEIRLKNIVSIFEGKVIVNDYPEFAYLCDGVHIGQEDLARYGSTSQRAIEKLRNIVGSKRWIGLSTHDKDEIECANGLDIDYIGLGALRATSTKPDANVLGRARLEELAGISSHPVAAIGGVRLNDTIKNVTWLVAGSALYED